MSINVKIDKEEFCSLLSLMHQFAAGLACGLENKDKKEEILSAIQGFQESIENLTFWINE